MANGWLVDGLWCFLWMNPVVKSHRYAVFTTNYYKRCEFRVISTLKTRSKFLSVDLLFLQLG
jgi:hypothetical protein